MIIAGTGHRPEKLGGHNAQAADYLQRLATDFLLAARPETVISGMALGWDTALAEAAIDLRTPFVAAVPFQGQEEAWPLGSRLHYAVLLEAAAEVVVVCKGGYSAAKMQRRNEWMVDHCTHLAALWDGSPGGTANCVCYAQRVGRIGWNLWPYYVDGLVNSRVSSKL